MTQPLADLAVTALDAASLALFLDLDGTLVDIADRPDMVVLAHETRVALQRLHAALGGAVAVVSGREIAQIDTVLTPLKLPVAGGHGLVHRSADGKVYTRDFDARQIETLEKRLSLTADGMDGVTLELKLGSMALHYRAAPDRRDDCLAAMTEAVADLNGIDVLDGKMVVEARPSGIDKGGAISDFLKEPPFRGRTPLFAGDDVTDEDGFRAVNAHGGLSIKIGGNHTSAGYRIDDAAGFRRWLGGLCEAVARGKVA